MREILPFERRTLLLCMAFLAAPGWAGCNEPESGGTEAIRTEAPGALLKFQCQPTFPFVGIGWRYERPPLPAAEEVIARPPGAKPVYGLYCWANEYIEFHEQIREIGWPVFRVAGPMNDEAMRVYARDGVEVMATLSTRLHGSFKPDAPMSDWRNRANYESDEAFIEDYVAGVVRWLERWGPDGTFFRENADLPHNPIRHIEVFNEPNFWYLDTPREQHADWARNPLSEEERLAVEARREKLYARLLVATYAAVKERWPGVAVVGFAAGGSAMADVRFIENVHAADPEVASSYDILSTHPYVTRPCAPEGTVMRSWGEYTIAGNLASIRKTMEANGAGDRPVWYTEMGWAVNLRSGGSFVDPIRPPDDGYAEAGSSLDGIPYDIDPRKWLDPLTQAAYIVRMYALALRMGVERHMFMSITDTDGFNSGFLRKDGSLRPGGIAVKNMIGLMPHPRLVEVVEDGKDGIFIYRFDPDVKDDADTPVTMAWSVELDRFSYPLVGGDRGLFPVGSRIRAVGMLGGERIVETGEASRTDFELGPVPVYLRKL